MYNSNDMIAIYYCAYVPLTRIIYYERTHQMHIIYNLVFNKSTYKYVYIHLDT